MIKHLSVVALLVAAACGGSDTTAAPTEPPPSAPGRYVLVQFHGRVVPDYSGTPALLSQELTYAPGGTWTGFRVVQYPTYTDTFFWTGSYVLSGVALTTTTLTVQSGGVKGPVVTATGKPSYGKLSATSLVNTDSATGETVVYQRR